MPSPQTSKENGELGGRPQASATLIKQEFRKALAERIKKDSDLWMDAIQDSAMGHFMEDAQGKIYKTKPDPSAWQKAMDRAFGAPEQEVDHLNNGKDFPTPLLHVLHNNVSNKEAGPTDKKD